MRNEIGKSKSWRQLQERLAEKGIGIRFKYKGRTDEVQGISFTKGAYTFKGSEIDRNFSFSKLDKHFGNAGMDTVENSRQQIVSAPILESEQTPQGATALQWVACSACSMFRRLLHRTKKLTGV